MHRLSSGIELRASGSPASFDPFLRDCEVVVSGKPFADVQKDGSMVSLACEEKEMVPVHLQNLSVWRNFVSFEDSRSKTRINLVEHWLALAGLLDTPLEIRFPQGVAPYSVPALREIALQIWAQREEEVASPLLIPDREFTWEGEKGVQMSIRPREDEGEGLILKGEFDFRGSRFEWLGKQEAVVDISHLTRQQITEIVGSRTPNTFPFPLPSWLLHLVGRSTWSSHLCHPPEEMEQLGFPPLRSGEVGEHKLFDLLATTITHPGLSAEIHLKRAGHKDHLAFMRAFERKVAEREIELKKAA